MHAHQRRVCTPARTPTYTDTRETAQPRAIRACLHGFAVFVYVCVRAEVCTVLRAIISTPCLHWLIKTYLGKHHLLLRQGLTTRSEASCLSLPVGTRIVNCWRLGSGVETEPDFRVRLSSSLSSLPSSLLPLFEMRIYFTREHLRDVLLSIFV